MSGSSCEEVTSRAVRSIAEAHHAVYGPQAAVSHLFRNRDHVLVLLKRLEHRFERYRLHVRANRFGIGRMESRAGRQLFEAVNDTDLCRNNVFRRCTGFYAAYHPLGGHDVEPLGFHVSHASTIR